MKKLFFLSLFLLVGFKAFSWGFFAHKLINEMAIYTLPPEMLYFYKFHGAYIKEHAVNPDKRRGVDPNEGPRHFIDLDNYNDLPENLPFFWHKAVDKYSEDTLKRHGVVPWHIYKVKRALTEAFRQKNLDKILRLSADLGHYIGDANVPLHTTKNYNGQFTGQHGIHGFWESRLPELFASRYNFWVGKAEYVENPQLRAWEAVYRAHVAVDSVLSFEKGMSMKVPEHQKFSYEDKGNSVVKVYSYEYSRYYHEILAGQVERQIRYSIKMVGDFWFSCWVDAGQPDLKKLIKRKNKDDSSASEEMLDDDENDTCK